MTLFELEQMDYDQLIKVCNTDPAHVAYGEHMPLEQLVELTGLDQQPEEERQAHFYRHILEMEELDKAYKAAESKAISARWGVSDEYKNSQPYHNEIYPY